MEEDMKACQGFDVFLRSGALCVGAKQCPDHLAQLVLPRVGWPPVAAPGSHLPQLLLVLLDPARPTTSWSCDVKKKVLPKAMR